MDKIHTLKEDKEVLKLIKLFENNTGCNAQYNNCPCNSCFHSIEADFKHICWLIILGLRGDYSSKEILQNIKEELDEQG